ncbi:PD-(D/E)XK nuclease family protein [Chlamydiota bacterium]
MDNIVTYNLSDSFLERLVDFVDTEYLKTGKDISRVAFIFGGKRPQLFMRKLLSERIGREFFSPGFFSINTFIEYIISSITSFKKFGALNASYVIYKLIKEQYPHIIHNRESFAQFLPWAREIISFIEQLDLENIPAESLSTVQAGAEIGYEIPSNINIMLENIVLLRKVYHSYMEEHKTFSRGYLYLFASQNIAKADISSYDEYCFCNFFYLYKTEQIVINHFLSCNRARLFLQGSPQDLPVLDELPKSVSFSIVPARIGHKRKTRVSFYSGINTHAQAGIIREILKGIKELDQTAIILPQSEHIMPLLSEISSVIDDFNISLGYPIKRNSLWSLLTGIFNTQETKKESLYYAKNYVRAIRHPFIKNVAISADYSVTRVLIHKIEEVVLGIIPSSIGGKLFIDLEDIQNSQELVNECQATLLSMDRTITQNELVAIMKTIHTLLFRNWEEITTFFEFSVALEKVLAVLVKKSLMRYYPLNLSVFDRLLSIADELQSSNFKREVFSKRDLFRIFHNKIDHERISFKGSPLRGVQLLGLFETRALTFKHVIIMDANESILPRRKRYDPLIPHEIKALLGITNHEVQIQRYLVDRLVKSADTVHMVYEENKNKKKERSRFLEQLLWENEKEHKGKCSFDLNRYDFTVSVSQKQKSIKKSPSMIDFLRQYRYSTTSINTYLNCPLQFHFRYVLGIDEKEEIKDAIEEKEIGIFIHELLEETFRQFKGKKVLITDSFKTYFFNQFNKKFTAKIDQKMHSDSFMLKEIMKLRLTQFLAYEKERSGEVSEVVLLEEKMEGELSSLNNTFNLTARIDRVDRLIDDSFLIIDYKTGRADVFGQFDEITRESVFSREMLKKKVKSFQLPLYIYLCKSNKQLLQEKKRDALIIQAGLYNIKNCQLKIYATKNTTDLPYNDALIEQLTVLLDEIIDKEVPFDQAKKDERFCGICPYKSMC